MSNIKYLINIIEVMNNLGKVGRMGRENGVIGGFFI